MTRLDWTKALVGGLGLVVGIVGMSLQIRWLVGAAIALLVLAFVLRFAERKAAGDPPP
jgi:hypothetical protein